jgi:hypothetical protein
MAVVERELPSGFWQRSIAMVRPVVDGGEVLSY